MVDEVAGKFGVPEEERAQLKLDLEEQTRDEVQCCSCDISLELFEVVHLNFMCKGHLLRKVIS